MILLKSKVTTTLRIDLTVFTDVERERKSRNCKYFSASSDSKNITIIGRHTSILTLKDNTYCYPMYISHLDRLRSTKLTKCRIYFQTPYPFTYVHFFKDNLIVLILKLNL